MIVYLDYVVAPLAGLLICCTILFIHFWYRVISQASLFEELPWVGTDNDSGILSRMKATLRSVGNTRNNLIEGYHKYSKQEKTYVLPNLITGPEVIVPMSHLKWLMEQPETTLNQGEVNTQFLQADHTMLHRNIVRDTVHQSVIRRELTAKLEDLNLDIIDELRLVFEEQWGTDTVEWKEVKVYDTMLEVISRISNRVLVGVPLCRNQDYLSSSSRFAQMVVLRAAFINLLPNLLRPLLAPFITWSDTRRYFSLAKYIIPTIRQRFEVSTQAVEEKQPNDYIQWAIQHAVKHWDPNERTPDMISRRLAVLSFAAIQSSVITITNALFDLAASPLGPSFMSSLHHEVEVEVSNAHDIWTKKTIARMIKIDSALRESMRLGGFISRGVSKLVMPPNGVTLPDGVHVPKGVKVGVSQYSVHHDEDVYKDAMVYDAFRFSRSNTEPPVLKVGAIEGAKKKRPVIVSTSPTFMAFSHGVHACPGRFFAANQLKLTLAHIALNYEIEPLAVRPPNKWFADSIAPPMHETMFIRRRKGSVAS